ncbi:MAG: DUF3108 domain-containing protein [Candidatus Nezhaarchaeales archaeon]
MSYSKIIMIILAVAFFSTAFFLFSSNRQQEKPETNITPPFNVGEQMMYEIKLVNSTGTYSLYTLNLSVVGTTEINSSQCFILRGEYLGYDVVMYSYVTTNNLTLLKTHMKSSSGSVTLLYDHKKNKCTISVTTSEGTSSQETDIKPDIQDSLSAIYYIRSLPLEEGYWCTFNQMTSKGVVLIKVSVEKKLQTIHIGLGNFTCYEVSLEAGGASNKVYITTSSERIPVMIEIPLGRETYQYWELIKLRTVH